MAKQYFYAPKAGPDPEALKRAFLKCGELALAGQHTVINIAVPAKGNLQGVMEKVLTEDGVRLLGRDNQLVLGEVTLHLVTKKLPLAYPGPVLAAWTSMDHVKSLAQAYQATDMVYLPWLDEELDEFKNLFSTGSAI